MANVQDDAATVSVTETPSGRLIEVGIAVDAVPPRWPCPACGKESKEDHAPGTRICSNRACRHRFTP